MKYSIRSKLTIFSVCIVLVSVLLISVPVVNIEFSKQQKNLYDVAELQMGNAYSSINEFLVKPESIVETMKSVLELKSFEKEESEALFADSIKNDENFYVLYYTNNIPIKDGGFMYSGDGWEPPSDYDQTKSGWFIEGFGKPQTVITSPYVDEESGSVVTTVLANVNAAGNRRGVVGLDIMLDTIKEMVDAVKLTKSGKTYLLQEDGLYITNEDSSKILQANFFTDNSVFNQYKKRETLTSSFISLSQKDGYYYASRKISDKAGWVIVTYGPVSELYSSVYKDIYLIISVAIIALILAFIVSIFVAGKIAKPIKVVDENVNEIASGKADLSRHIAVSSHDEVGSLVNGFNLFVDKLADIVRQLKASKTDLVNIDGSLQESISQASEAIKKILGNIKKVGNEVAGQSQAVTQTSAAVAEIAENINSLERMIENQSRGVSDASSAVEQMIGNISSVNNSMDKMAMSFEKLAESAQNGANLQVDANEKIERIKDQSETLLEANLAIAAIAEQTNLLAMNAAIEAAHAGDAGKGFSVVADEIRKLSETSSEQSKTIGNELTQIRVSIESMVNASQQSSEAFHTVTTKIQETDQLVRQIKAAMEEQQEGSKQIVDALKTMNDSTSEVRVASHEMLEGNQLILVEVQNLQDTTFHIKDSMSEMEASAEEINGTSVNLFNISSSVKASVEKIGNEIDEFNA